MIFKNEAKFIMRDGNVKLTEGLTYYSDRYDFDIYVPEAFVSDQASVPDFVPAFIVNDTGRITYPSIVHDYLYESGGLDGAVPKYVADIIFYDAMRERGMPRWRASIAYLAVKFFGRYREVY